MKAFDPKSLTRVLILVIILSLLFSTHALAATLVIDGSFSDWDGHPFIADSRGDTTPPRVDLFSVYWGTNPGVSNVYFMIERDYPGGRGNADVIYRLFIDTNCNGSVNEERDRIIIVDYKPSNHSGFTAVTITNGKSGFISSSSGNWGDAAGEAPLGGTRTEFSVSFSDLGISPNQQICFSVASFQNMSDTTPADQTDQVTWAPVPALGYPLLALVVLGVLFFAWRNRSRFQLNTE